MGQSTSTRSATGSDIGIHSTVKKTQWLEISFYYYTSQISRKSAELKIKVQHYMDIITVLPSLKISLQQIVIYANSVFMQVRLYLNFETIPLTLGWLSVCTLIYHIMTSL